MDYKALYHLLFNGITGEIQRLQALQQQAEALFLELAEEEEEEEKPRA